MIFQITILAFYFSGVIIAIREHGDTIKPYQYWITPFLAIIMYLAIIYFGGFFNVFKWPQIIVISTICAVFLVSILEAFGELKPATKANAYDRIITASLQQVLLCWGGFYHL